VKAVRAYYAMKKVDHIKHKLKAANARLHEARKTGSKRLISHAQHKVEKVTIIYTSAKVRANRATIRAAEVKAAVKAHHSRRLVKKSEHLRHTVHVLRKKYEVVRKSGT